MPKQKNNGFWIKKHLPTNSRRQSDKHSFFDKDDTFKHRHGRVQVIAVDQKIISKREYLGHGSRVLTGFVDIEKLIRVRDDCGETRVIFLEKILPFQILELELQRESHEEE